MLSTLSETQRELVSDSLVYRYDPELAPESSHGEGADALPIHQVQAGLQHSFTRETCTRPPRHLETIPRAVTVNPRSAAVFSRRLSNPHVG